MFGENENEMIDWATPDSEEISEGAKEAIDTTKAVLKAMDGEFFFLQAQSWSNMYNAAMKQGFSPEDSLRLTIASIQKR